MPTTTPDSVTELAEQRDRQRRARFAELLREPNKKSELLKAGEELGLTPEKIDACERAVTEAARLTKYIDRFDEDLAAANRQVSEVGAAAMKTLLAEAIGMINNCDLSNLEIILKRAASEERKYRVEAAMIPVRQVEEQLHARGLVGQLQDKHSERLHKLAKLREQNPLAFPDSTE